MNSICSKILRETIDAIHEGFSKYLDKSLMLDSAGFGRPMTSWWAPWAQYSFEKKWYFSWFRKKVRNTLTISFVNLMGDSLNWYCIHIDLRKKLIIMLFFLFISNYISFSFYPFDDFFASNFTSSGLGTEFEKVRNYRHLQDNTLYRVN